MGGQYLAQWPLLEGGQYLAQLPLLSLSLLDSPFSRAVGANYLLQTGLAMALRRLLRYPTVQTLKNTATMDETDM